MHDKRILYIGPYRDFSGAGNAARNYIQALFENGHDICIAPVFYTGDIYPEHEISSDILPLEQNQLKSYDVIIQHCHPFDYVFNSKFDLNIGLYQFNSCSIHPSIISRLKLMDRIIVNSSFNHKVLYNIFPLNNINVVPELIDHRLKENEYLEYSWLKTSHKPIVFYTIGDFVDRKNIQQIIKAFIYLFNHDDNVELVIKTKSHHSHKQKDLINKELEYNINKIYSTIRKDKKNAKQPKIMIGQFDYKHILSLHHNSNIFISTSMAENFGYCALEAALFDNYVIVNENSSIAEISDSFIKTQSKPTQTNDSYTSNFIDNSIKDFWYETNFDHLCQNMLKAYYMAIAKPKNSYNLTPYYYNNANNILI
jgi:glycosyltransferase involved in cell wall biosynthesis